MSRASLNVEPLERRTVPTLFGAAGGVPLGGWAGWRMALESG